MMAVRSIALLALLAIVCANTVSAQRCGGVRGFFLETGSEEMMAPQEEMYPALLETAVGECPHKCLKYHISATQSEMMYFSCSGTNCDNCAPTKQSMVDCDNFLTRLGKSGGIATKLRNLIPSSIREKIKQLAPASAAEKDARKYASASGEVTMCTTPTQLHCFEGVSTKSLMEVMAAKSLMEMEAEAAPKAGAGGAVKREHRCVGSGANKKCGVYRTTAADSARRVAQVTENRKKLAAMKAKEKKKAAATGKKPAAGKAGKPAAKKAAAGGKAGKKPKVKMLNQPPALSAGAAAGRKTSAGAAKGKKPAGKKPVAKKTVAKKAAGAKKPAARKPAARKAAPRKAAPRKAAPRKAAPRKAAPRKAAPRKAAPKRSGPTAAQKQAAARKLAAQRKAAAAKGKKGKKQF